MAENWTHDRPLPAPPNKKRNRRVEQARLELPMPMPLEQLDEGAAQPAPAAERGFAVVDFYV